MGASVAAMDHPSCGNDFRVRSDSTRRVWVGAEERWWAGKEDKMAQLAPDRLQAEFSGELIRPDDPQYDALRRVFNGAVDRHPALIARCTGRRDVLAAVNQARDHGLEIAVYGGVRGHAVCDDGMVSTFGR